MKKLLMMISAAVCLALGANADGTTLTWNGTEGASWEGTNWLNGETPSAWVDGASAVFPSAATVTLDGTAIVSNMTTLGALTLTGTVASEYGDEVFLPKNNSVLVFPGLRLADITGLSALMGGNAIRGGEVLLPAIGCRYDHNGTVGKIQFQIHQGIIKCVNVELTEQSDGIHARAESACYVEDGSFWLGMDVDSAKVKRNNVATSRTASGYGVCNLAASVARLQLVGEATLGGELMFSNAVLEVTAPIAQEWAQPVKCPNGRLEVKGFSGTSLDKTFGITDPNVEKAAAQWMSKTAGGTVLTNLVLARTTPVSAVLRGTAIGYNGAGTPYHVQSDGETMTFQLHHWVNGIKGVKVELKQSGANVTARWVKGWWWAESKGCTRDMMGCDLEAKQAELGTSVIENNGGSYGVKSLTLRTVDVTSLTVSNAKNCHDVLVDHGQIVFSSNDGMPTCLTVRNEAYAIYGSGITYAYGASKIGYGKTRRFESGSTLLLQQGLATEPQARFIFDGSVFRNWMYHSTSLDGNNYINELTLTNGARVVGNPLRCGYFNVTNETHYLSAGSTANTIDTGIDLFRHNSTGNMTNILILTTSADLAITGGIYDSPGDGNKGACIVKRGDATLTFSGTNTFAGMLTVEAGTIALGSDTALPASAPLKLAGGTISCGVTTNATGRLKLSGNATINLGEGALTFADSSDEAWTEGATLTVTGADPLSAQAIRFGTSANGLTSAQRRAIRYNGEKCYLDGNGYLRPGSNGLIISFH